MKNKVKYLLTGLILLLLFFNCKTKYIHVPVETIKTEKEYINKWHRDSIHVHDSIFIELKGDTFFQYKYKTLYKEIVRIDTVLEVDSIKVDKPYPVVEIKEVNRLENWQIFLMVLGGIFIGVLGYRLFRFLKK